MKNRLLFLIFLSAFSFGQKKKSSNNSSGWDVVCYLPNGEKCSQEQSKGKSIYDFSSHFEEKSRTWNTFINGQDVIIIFKAFTKTPLFLLTPKEKQFSAEKINELISSVNKDNSDYFYYWEQYPYGGHHLGFKSSVQRYIEKGILDRQFVLDTMDNPDEYKETLYDGQKALCYIYRDPGIRIYFINDIAVGYEDIK